MVMKLKILPLILITVFIFPVMTLGEHLLTPYVGQITWPSIFLLSIIFIPILLKDFFKKRIKNLTGIYLNLMWIILPFLLLSLISIVWGILPGANWEGGLRDTVFDLYHWVLLMLSITIAQSKTVSKYHRIIFLIVLVGASMGIWADYFNPGTFSKENMNRAAGFSGNANGDAKVIVWLCIAAINWKKSGLLNLIVLTFSWLTIFPTLSVNNSILLFFVTGYYFFLGIKENSGSHFIKKVSMVTAPLLFVLILQPLWVDMKESGDTFNNKSAKLRFENISNIFEGDFSFFTEHSRAGLAHKFLVIISEEPVIGRGTGYANSVHEGTHNMYLMQWVDKGVLGLLAYLLMVAGAFWHFYRLESKQGLIFAFVFFGSGFFTHNLFNDRTFILLLGMLGTLAYLEKSKKISSLNFVKTSALKGQLTTTKENYLS